MTTIKGVEERLLCCLNDRLLVNEPMARHTSWRIGGPAEYFVEPQNTEELKKCILLAKELQIPLTIVGNGTNLLVKDTGIPGLVIKIGRGFSDININGGVITAGAGALLPAVARAAMDHHLSGFSWSAGIPGTIGGAVIMNAGANGSCISEVIQTVDVINRDGELLELGHEQLCFDYRISALQDSELIVVDAKFLCSPGDHNEIKKEMNKYIAKRKEMQPQGYPNAGSVFKNPPGDSAGRLLDVSGCKGLKVGNAQVSTVHANWIINLGGATADDVLTLICQVKEIVKDKTGVALQLEVRVLG
ncbi:MAG: UDP-N-acetylmuramate dehydrogenase [Firmicutes bacterium]|nr:UDP-N-acetylmuramate dehydrogenase [Bacillota bacterium]